MYHVTNPVSRPSFYYLLVIPLLLDFLSHFFISHMISSTDLLHPSPASYFKTLQVFPICFPKCPCFSTVTKVCSEYSKLLVSSLNWSTIADEKSLHVKNCFCHGNPGYNFLCTSCIICYHATQIVEIFHILRFLFYHNLYWGWVPWDFHHHCFSMFISIPQHLPISYSLSVMSCSIASSLASRTRSSAYFTLRITIPCILKSQQLSWASLLRYSLYKLNTIGNKQHPCLTPIPVFTFIGSLLSCFSLTLWSMYSFCQSVPVTFRICINLVQFTRSSVFC